MITEDQAFDSIQKSIREVLPDVGSKDIKKEDSLNALGANSIDRNEIIIRSMEDLNIKVPLMELGNTHNIKELIQIFLTKSSE